MKTYDHAAFMSCYFPSFVYYYYYYYLFNGNIIALYCSLAFWEVKKLALLVKSLVGID
jgi:hypothetical protein